VIPYYLGTAVPSARWRASSAASTNSEYVWLTAHDQVQLHAEEYPTADKPGAERTMPRRSRNHHHAAPSMWCSSLSPEAPESLHPRLIMRARPLRPEANSTHENPVAFTQFAAVACGT